MVFDWMITVVSPRCMLLDVVVTVRVTLQPVRAIAASMTAGRRYFFIAMELFGKGHTLNKNNKNTCAGCCPYGRCIFVRLSAFVSMLPRRPPRATPMRFISHATNPLQPPQPTLYSPSPTNSIYQPYNPQKSMVSLNKEFGNHHGLYCNIKKALA